MNRNLLEDQMKFALLNSGGNQPTGDLMGADDLAFFAPIDAKEAKAKAMQTTATEWHEYGDVRWPTRAAWVEPVNGIGVLVLREEIVPEGDLPLELCGLRQPPFQLIDVSYRGQDYIESAHNLYEDLMAEPPEGPKNGEPKYVQSYRIFQKSSSGKIAAIADYTDQLNDDGVAIPMMRFARIQSSDIPTARVTLHCLFTWRRLYAQGFPFTRIDQQEKLLPIYRADGEKSPLWEDYHPRRMLKTRPYLRLTGFHWRNGAMNLSDHDRINEAIRLGLNRELVTIKRDRRDLVRSFWFNESLVNSCFGAIVNRELGGSIYVIPDRLVEEFDNTDCSEVRLSDIKLPFEDTFVRFTPPDALFLDENCEVDGCYLAKQSEELLVVITSRRVGVDYANSIPVSAIDPIFSIHLPLNNPEITVEEAVALGVQDYLKRNQPPTEDVSQTVELPNGAASYIQDVRKTNRALRSQRYISQKAAFDRCLNIVVNAACFIAFRPEDVEESWAGEPPPDILAAAESVPQGRHALERKAGALEKLSRGDYTRIKICGKKLFESDETSGTHASPRAHWRRGHWRRQKHGVGLLLITLKWIRPTVVRKNAGAPVESRIYDIDANS